MKVCLASRAPEVWVGADHLSACWMNYKEGAEKNKLEYDEDGNVSYIYLDGGEEA